jgi:ribonuclease VapC
VSPDVGSVVFDSSVVLAWLHDEAGCDVILPLIQRSLLSSVNAAEVQTRLVSQGTDRKAAWEDILASVAAIVPFDAEQAEAAGALVRQTKPFGLSLGDRACLALALSLGVPIYTADRAWMQVDVSVPVLLVR